MPTALDPRVSPSVSGSAVATMLELSRGLGPAFRLWQLLMARRDPRTGLVRVFREDMVAPLGFVRQSIQTVMRGLRRLLDVGLVVPTRWIPGGRPVLEREVYGASTQRTVEGEAQFLLPGSALLSIRKQFHRGGVRPGAGRPRKEMLTYSNGYTKPISNRVERNVNKKNQTGSAYKEDLDLISILISDAEEAPQEPERRDAREAPLDLVSEVGLVLGGSGTPRRTPVNVYELVMRGLAPEPPTDRLVPRVKVPPPPFVDEFSDEQAADYVLKCWIAIQRSHYGLARKLTTARRSKHHDAIVKAVAALKKHRIAPAAWIWWSCGKWRGTHATNKPPPFAWLISEARIETRGGWCRKETSLGGRLVYPPALTRLVRTWDAMRQALVTAGATLNLTDDQVRGIVGEHFPAGAESMVEAARSELWDVEAGFRARLARGEFLDEWVK